MFRYENWFVSHRTYVQQKCVQCKSKFLWELLKDFLNCSFIDGFLNQINNHFLLYILHIYTTWKKMNVNSESIPIRHGKIRLNNKIVLSYLDNVLVIYCQHNWCSKYIRQDKNILYLKPRGCRTIVICNRVYLFTLTTITK